VLHLAIDAVADGEIDEPVLAAKSRYLPPMGTAGLLRNLVSG
jgi:hypothetical protein